MGIDDNKLASLYKVKRYYLMGSFVLFIIGLLIEAFMCTVEPQYEAIKTVAASINGDRVITRWVLSFPVYYHVLRAISIFLYTLAASVFIAVSVSRQIEKLDGIKEEERLRELQKAINNDVFDALFKSLMPKEIFTVIKEEVIENKIIRKNAKWYYDFTESSEGQVELRQTLKYTLHNISQHDVRNPVKARILKSSDSECCVQRVCCVEDGVISLNYHHESTVENEDVTIVTNGPVLIAEFNIIVPAKKEIEMTMVYLHKFKEKVQDTYFSKYPIINAILTVTFPPEYDFHIFPSFSSELRETLVENNRRIYELSGAILPHQGFEYSLIKRL